MVGEQVVECQGSDREFTDVSERDVVSPRSLSSPIGLHRVLAPHGVLPQAAERLDPSAELWPDEVRIAVERLNLDAASYRQLFEANGGDGAAIRAAVLAIVGAR